MELLTGNEACVRGALRAGVRFYGGYPITPSSEIAEEMSRELPKVGGVYMQMEDEIGSLGACIGARLAGMRAMTATSGPGFSLMQEHIGFASMAEVPVLVVNVMRGGPSTGLPTKVSQGDLLQAIWGSHGDKALVVLVPWSVEETYELTIKAVNLSEMLRLPAILLMDEVIAHLREAVELPEGVEVYRAPELTTPQEEYLHFGDGTEYLAPFANYGQRRFHITGLYHGPDGFPSNDPRVAAWKLDRLLRKLRDNAELLADYREYHTQDAELLFVAVGSVARVTLDVVEELRERGVRAGLLRPRVLWPFPYDAVRRLARRAKRVVVPEENMGQLIHLVREAACDTPVQGINREDGELMSPSDILEGIGGLP